MKILLLGPVEVTSNGDPIALGGPKERALLALLALRAGDGGLRRRADRRAVGRGAARDRLQARPAVRVARAQGAGLGGRTATLIVTHGRGYELRVAREQVDVGRFERLLAQGAAREALALWRGRPLADIDRRAVRGRRGRAGWRRCARSRSSSPSTRTSHAGRHREVLAEIEGLLAHEPLRERLHALRMLALYRAGRQAEALEAYREARAVLIEEVGIEPGPELRRMQEAILRQDPSLHPPPETAFPTREEALERLGDAAGRAAAGRAGWRVGGGRRGGRRRRAAGAARARGEPSRRGAVRPSRAWRRSTSATRTSSSAASGSSPSSWRACPARG